MAITKTVKFQVELSQAQLLFLYDVLGETPGADTQESLFEEIESALRDLGLENFRRDDITGDKVDLSAHLGMIWEQAHEYEG